MSDYETLRGFEDRLDQIETQLDNFEQFLKDKFPEYFSNEDEVVEE